MKLICFGISVCCLIIMLATATGAATRPETPLLPANYSSPDGRYSLTVTPGAPDGSGPAQYLFREDNVTRWGEIRPYTMQGVHITATGQVAGYSYSGGLTGEQPGNLLELWLLDAGGAIVYHRQFFRQPEVLDAPPYPTCAGVIVDERNNRVAYRVTPPQLASQMCNTWPQVDLATGQELPPLRLVYAALGLPDQVTLDAVHVLDGPATLLLCFSRWELVSGPGDISAASVKTGSYFMLTDWDLGTVWRNENPGDLDYRQLGVSRELAAAAGQPGNLCRVGADARSFSIAHLASNEEVRYQLDSAGLPEEAARHPIHWRPGAVPTVAPRPLIPAPAPVPLPPPTPRTAVSQPLASTPAGFPAHYAEFDFDENGRIGLLAPGAERVFILADASGKVISRQPLPEVTGGAVLAYLGADFWGLLVNNVYQPARFWLIGGELQANREITLGLAGASRLAATPDGGFVVLSTTDGGMLRKYDCFGRPDWESTARYPQPGGLLKPVDIAVDNTGTIIVLNMLPGMLQYFREDGTWLRDLELEPAIGRSLDYPTRLAVDGEGTVFVMESAGRKRIYRFAADGRWTGEFSARNQAGQAIEHISDVVIDHENRLWVSDRRAVRLDARGLADVWLGQAGDAPATQQLQ